jgi:hypothetical protein
VTLKFPPFVKSSIQSSPRKWQKFRQILQFQNRFSQPSITAKMATKTTKAKRLKWRKFAIPPDKVRCSGQNGRQIRQRQLGAKAFPSVSICADCAHTFSIGEKFGNFVNFTRPFCEKSELEGLDNCGKKPKKGILAQQFPVFAAAGGGAAAVEGELLRKGKVPRCEFQVKDTTRPLIHLQESNFSTKVLYVSSSS